MTLGNMRELKVRNLIVKPTKPRDGWRGSTLSANL
jgi:hypothetical protein